MYTAALACIIGRSLVWPYCFQNSNRNNGSKLRTQTTVSFAAVNLIVQKDYTAVHCNTVWRALVTNGRKAGIVPIQKENIPV